MSQLIPFNFNQHAIRVIQDEQGEPWFVLSDICKALGLDNATKVKARLDEDELQVVDLKALNQIQGNKYNDLQAVVLYRGHETLPLYLSMTYLFCFSGKVQRA